MSRCNRAAGMKIASRLGLSLLDGVLNGINNAASLVFQTAMPKSPTSPVTANGRVPFT